MTDDSDSAGREKDTPLSFIGRFFRRRRNAAEEAPAGVPLADGERIYAVGDIHGRSDLLDLLWGRIRQDLRDRPAAQAHLVYLGDYVDRGRDSSGVLDRLVAPPPDLPPATCLMGNHDLVFRDFLAGQDVGNLWRQFGGYETMRSYDVDPPPQTGRRWIEAVREELREQVPERHIEWLRGLALSLDRPPYFFCHAGVRPGIPVERQDAATLLWIREEFLLSDADFGRIVVHGHTPVPEPEVRRNRVGIDTGAFASGVLSCAAVEVGSVRILQARP